MLKDNLGLILELKNNKNPEEGLLQIKENNYCAAFENDDFNPGPDKIDVKYYILAGIAMDEKQK